MLCSHRFCKCLCFNSFHGSIHRTSHHERRQNILSIRCSPSNRNDLLWIQWTRSIFILHATSKRGDGRRQLLKTLLHIMVAFQSILSLGVEL